MTHKITKAAAILIAAILLTLGYVFGIHTKLAGAAIAVFSPATCYTAAATTSAAVIGNGTATSTVTCDLGFEGARSAALLVQYAASTTSGVLKIDLEYSMNGIDWFADNTFADNGLSTTTPAQFLNAANTRQWRYASTSVGGATVAQDPAYKTFPISVPTRYVRAIFSMTGAQGMVWARITPRAEVN